MTDYHINDDWILARVMGQSTSFSQWVQELLNVTEKSLVAKNPEKAAEFRKKRDLLQLKEVDEKLKKVDEKVLANMERLSRLGSLGDFITTAVSSIVEKRLQQSLGDEFDFNIDFITGKRKSLASALYDVTKERGIDSEGILYLIQSLPDLESFLYSTSVKKYYRDHTEHQLRVAVLGDFLLEQDLEQGTLQGIIADILDIGKPLLKEKIWWIVGLIHDIGYPLSKMTTAVNWALLNQILKCYPHLDLDVVPMEVNLSKSTSQQAYMTLLEEGLSQEARELLRKGVGNNETPVLQPITFSGSPHGHPEFAFQSDIALDHGVVGALTFLRSLGSPEEIKENKDEYEGYILAAQAIALHNFKGRLDDFIFDTNPLAFLLVLIDEMQEWGRPIPLQIRDSYFTTELKKVALLDEIILTIDEFEWMMQYRNIQAKALIHFDFNRLCDGKNKAFYRLNRGSHFQETTILLQDFEEREEETKDDDSPEVYSSSKSEKKRLPLVRRGIKRQKDQNERQIGEFRIMI
ncbi:MAG: hypothetical protein HXS44_03755 [Theionarchaea archaeon]|nr:hypothetical protein [Theionarchaea archaeon]